MSEFNKKFDKLLDKYQKVYEALDEYTNLHDQCLFDYQGYCESLEEDGLAELDYIHLKKRVKTLKQLLKAYQKLEDLEAVFS